MDIPTNLPRHINFWVSLFGFAGTASIIFFAHMVRADVGLARARFAEYGNTAWALVFWGVWWLALLVVYSPALKYQESLNLTLIALDIGNFSILLCAYAITQDKTFSIGKIWLVIFPFVLMLLWDFIAPIYQEKALMPTVITVSPSLVLSGVSCVLMGWVFVVRWGMFGAPMLLLYLIYALLQPSPYIGKLLPIDIGLDSDFLQVVFLCLATLKALILFSVPVYLLPPMSADFNAAKFLPAESFSPPPRPFKWVLSLFVALLTPVVGGVVDVVFTESAKSFVRQYMHPTSQPSGKQVEEKH